MGHLLRIAALDCHDVYDDPLRYSEPWQRLLCGVVMVACGFWLANRGGCRWIYNRARWLDYVAIGIGYGIFCAGIGVLAFGHMWPPKQVCGPQFRPLTLPAHYDRVDRHKCGGCE